LSPAERKIVLSSFKSRLESSNANCYIRSHSFGKFIPNCRCGVTKGISGEVKRCWTALEDVCTARPSLAILELHVSRVFTKLNRTIKTLLILTYLFSYVCNLSKIANILNAAEAGHFKTKLRNFPRLLHFTDGERISSSLSLSLSLSIILHR